MHPHLGGAFLVLRGLPGGRPGGVGRPWAPGFAVDGEDPPGPHHGTPPTLLGTWEPSSQAPHPEWTCLAVGSAGQDGHRVSSVTSKLNSQNRQVACPTWAPASVSPVVRVPLRGGGPDSCRLLSTLDPTPDP